jgi:ribosome-binding factor A
LGRRLSLRYLPDIIFKKDVSGIRGDRIHQLLAGLHDHVGQRQTPEDLTEEPNVSGS